jgi:hypothetical protein
VAEKGVYLPKDAPRGAVYDMIFVDGRGRVKFWQTAERYLKPGGYVVFDDAERKKYREIIQIIEETYEDVTKIWKDKMPKQYLEYPGGPEIADSWEHLEPKFKQTLPKPYVLIARKPE